MGIESRSGVGGGESGDGGRGESGGREEEE